MRLTKLLALMLIIALPAFIPLMNAQLGVSNLNFGPTFITYTQNTVVNMIINGGVGPYTANLIWCKMDLNPPSNPPMCAALPSGVLANTIRSTLPTGNYLTFTVNAFSYNTMQVAFGGTTYDIITNAVITTNIIAATNSMDSANAVFANTVYGPWIFNGIVADSGTNVMALTLQPAPIPIIGINPATPQLQFLAPGGFLAFITNYGNNTLTITKINPSNIPASNVIATIPVGSEPVSLVAPPQQMSATAPSIVGTVNYGSNSVTMINTAIKEAMTNMSFGAGSQPIAVAPEANSVAQGMAFADYGTDKIVIVTPSQNGFASFGISLAGKINGPDAVDTFFDRSGSGTLWVAGKDSNSVVPINLATMQVGNVINLGAGAMPEGIAAAPFGYVYVADYGTNMISVINASSSNPGVIANIVRDGPMAFNGPKSIIVDYSSPKFYVTNYNSNTIAIVDGMSYHIMQEVAVNSLPVSNPNYVTVSPDGALLYVSNFGANVISVLSTSDYSIQGTLPANEPTGVNLFSNYFYNGTAPSNVVFNVSSPGNQLTATLSQMTSPGNFIPIGTTTNIISYQFNSATTNNLMFAFSTGGNANYFPSMIAKGFDIMPSFPQIQMTLTLANGMIITLNKQGQSLSLSGLPGAIFPMTLTANIQTFGNQLPGNVFLNGVTVNSFGQGFSETYNSLGSGTQSFIFNAISNGNYIAVDPSITLDVLSQQTSSGGGGGPGITHVTLSDNIASTANSTTPVFTTYAVSQSGVASNAIYQMQLPDAAGFSTGQLLNISFACSFYAGGTRYDFTGIVYGIGASARCNQNYTVYGGTIEALYSPSEASTTVSTTGATTTIPASPNLIRINGSISFNSHANISAHMPLYINFTNSRLLLQIRLNSTASTNANIIVTNITNSLSLPSLTGMERDLAINVSVAPPENTTVNITVGYRCGIASNSIAPYILANNTWEPIKPFTVDANACTLSFTVPADPVVALYSIKQNNSTSSTASTVSSVPSTSTIQPSRQSVRNYTPIYAAIVVIMVIIVLAYAYSRRKK